jgi:hypothetical protein
MISKPDSGLLIVARGTTVNPDSSAPTLAHAAEIRRRKIFAKVGARNKTASGASRPNSKKANHADFTDFHLRIFRDG